MVDADWLRFEDLDIYQINPGHSRAVVLLHGYGADAGDLAPLSQALRCKHPVSWYFPNGSLQVPIGPMMMGRGWFPIDIEGLESAMQRGEHRELAHFRPEGLQILSEKIGRWVRGLKKQHEQILLGGFSQGAMLAVDSYLQNNIDVDGLILLSGSPMNLPQWESCIVERKPVPFFASHGRQDPILSFVGAQMLVNFLKQYQFTGDLLPFDGGHEIPPQVLQQLNIFINTQIG